MFLDEELEKVYSENRNDEKIVLTRKILNVLVSRLPNPDNGTYKGVDDFLCSIKQVDNGWRLFASRHPELNKNLWRDYVISFDTDGKFSRAFNW